MVAGMSLGVETVEDVVHEILSMQRLLPPRPTVEQYEAAVEALGRADQLLASRLDDLAKSERPDGVPEQVFAALQEMREDVLRMQVHEHKRPWLTVVKLELRHQRYDQLLRKARQVQQPGPGQVPDKEVNANGGTNSVLNGFESSSSGEFSDDAVRSSNVQRFHANSYGTPGQGGGSPTSATISSLALETGRAFVAQTTRPLVVQHAPEFQSRKTTPRTAAVTPDVPPPPPAAEPKALSKIDEDVQSPFCPPKLVAIFEEAADNASESISVVDTFVRESILLPDSVFSMLSNLKVLELSGNRIVKLPESIGELKQLTELDVQSNQLTSLPEGLGLLKNLKKLNVEKNAIEELPWSIGGCLALEELRADFNQLKALPEAIGNLGNLRILTIHLNCLKGLPTTIAYLTNLQELDVHFNQLESVPESLCFVTSLRKLDISSNFHALRFLPYKIGNLQELAELDISYNSILELPDSFVNLTNLRKLRLEGNPWRVPPLQVTQKGKEAVFEYMHERIKQKHEEKLARKKRSFVVKAAHACCGYFGTLCQPRPGDSGLNILA